MRIVTLLLALLCAPSLAAEPAQSSEPELLINVDQLQQRLGDEPRLFRNKTEAEARANPPETILDVRAEKAFREGTIVTARHVDIREWKAAFGNGQDANAWSKRLGGILLGEDSTVVIFDDTVTPNAARTWWILKYWGIRDVRILNGGARWQSWTPPGPQWLMQSPSPTEFTAKPHPNRLATADEVLGIARSGGACLIDTRTAGEHSAGYIPTASHSDWTAYVDPETGKMHSAEQLQKLLDAAGFDPDGRNVAYCQSGGRASVVAFAMELMGGHQVENYFGSWGEWSRLPQAPVAKP